MRPDPERAAPSPPAGLSQPALEVWQCFVAAYPRRFAGSDVAALIGLEALVRAGDRHRQAREVIDHDGLLLTEASGARQAHPLLRTEHIAATDALRALRALRLEVEPKPKTEAALDPLERLQLAASARGAALRRSFAPPTATERGVE